MALSDFFDRLFRRGPRRDSPATEREDALRRHQDRLDAVRSRESGYAPRASWTDFSRGQFGGDASGH